MPVIMFIEGFVEECIVVKEGRRLAVRYTGINTEINKGTFDVWLKSSSRRKYKETPNSARNMVESRRRTHREGNNRSKFYCQIITFLTTERVVRYCLPAAIIGSSQQY